jgi:arsenate reductase (thioredoxin)
MEKQKVLFLCIHNSARSQMAEAFLKQYAQDRFDVMSAGLEPGKLNPNAVEVMKEKGMDISGNKTKSVFDLYNQNMTFTYVVTVCDKEAADMCPFFPGVAEKFHWPFDDPSKFTGTREEILLNTRKVRDEIEVAVKKFIAQHQ